MDESLLRTLLGALIFRMGGEVILTPENIDEARQTAPGFQVLVTPDNRIILRSKGRESCEDAVKGGYAV